MSQQHPLFTFDCTCFRMRRAARLVTQLYDAHLKPTGLRITQFSLLAALELGGAQPLNHLAAALGMDRTTLTRNLKPLQQTALVTVGAGPDRRTRTVALTAAGRRALQAAVPRWRQAQQTAAASIGPGHLGPLHAALDAAAGRLQSAVAVLEESAS